MAERIRDRADGKAREARTLLQRTAEEYRKVLDIEDEEERREQLYRLAERFFFAPENIALRRSQLRAHGYFGDEGELWARGGDMGPLYLAFENIIQWLPKLLESENTLPFRWTLMVKDWFTDWEKLTHGTEAHPRFSLDAQGPGDGEAGLSSYQIASSYAPLDVDEEMAALEKRTGISTEDLYAVADRISSGHARSSTPALRRILLGGLAEDNVEQQMESGSDRADGFSLRAADVFWRRSVLLTAASK